MRLATGTRTNINRHQFLAGSAATLLAAFGRPVGAQETSIDQPLPLAGLPSQAELWRWIEAINSFGPRLTGSPAQARVVDFLAGELAKLGLTVERDHRQLQRWTPGTTSLSLSDGTQISIAAPYPYSGRTPPTGISTSMVWFDGILHSFGSARGKIAVVAVKRRDLTSGLIDLAMIRKTRLPDHHADFADPDVTPLATGLLGVPLERAREDGVLAVVCVFQGISEDELAGQVLPFTTPYRDIPAIWIGERQGDVLKAAIARKQTARLILDATLEQASTDTVYAVLPGSTAGETIIINTHTDGPNACEENGGAGVLALATYFSGLPRSARRRSLVFVLVTGHFQIPQLGKHGNQATSAWLESHPELWDGANGHAKAVAGVTIEHLGCTEWKDDPAEGRPAPTGRLELDLIYTANSSLNDVYVRATQGRTKLRAVTASPTIAQVMLGEGQPLYNVGIPVISSCPIPDYLCQILPSGGLSRLDPEYAHQQVSTFARAVSYLDAMPTDRIGGVPFHPRLQGRRWLRDTFPPMTASAVTSPSGTR